MTKTQIKNRQYAIDSNRKPILTNDNRKKSLLSLAVLNKIIAVMLAISGLLYVVVINDLAICGIVLEELKKDELEMHKIADNYELAIIKLESFDNINEKAKSLKMVKVEKIEYIAINNNEVAKK